MLTTMLTLMLLTGSPESDDIRSAYTLLQTGINRFDETTLLKAINRFDSLSERQPGNGQALIGAGWARYQLGTYYMTRKMGDKVTDSYDANMKVAEKLSEVKGFEADGLVLKAAITMNKLSVSGGASAALLSFKIHGWLDEAEDLRPDHPRLHLIRGMMYFFTPAMFGGSAEKALSFFTQSVKSFEAVARQAPPADHLGFAESCAWAAQAEFKLGNGDSARKWCERALSIQPDYGMIRQRLLPMINEKFPE
ncbi:MAG: hypothetical protein HUU10_10870 [Bacteroidetes bacterium]|nr:hypothetical protein [Bacteroidota bacterium]